MPIHVAISRQVRPGCEAEFQQALREFFQASFAHEGVLGVTMIVPPEGGILREYGILRTFASERERAAFHASPLFQAWEERIAPLTIGGWSSRPLHGLEAWFRGPDLPPARWKMAMVTLIGVYPLGLLLTLFLSPRLRGLSIPVQSFLVSALIVVCLTWVVMPLLTRWFQPWLRSRPQQADLPTRVERR